ncbi:hypothetical protein [Kitasatospora sp. NPDC059571]|uniref:hypothetical protein n=1 Tax=Kitasatospora sp. NPDC059571 TaxID=3346871 RepID=UPI00369195B0
MVRPPRRAAALAAAGAALLAVAGCTGGPGAAVPALTPPALGTPAPPPSGREGMLQLPLSAYGLSSDESARQQQAVRALTADCMHRAGYTSFTGDDAFDGGSGRVSDANAMPGGAFGYLPATVAPVQGFHAARPPAAPAPPRAPSSEAERGAAEDCVRKALAALPTGDRAGSDLVTRLFGESQAATAKDARVVAATRAWAGCMTAAGYPDATPDGLVARYRGPGSPGRDELAAAEADAACTTGSNLAGIWFAVIAGYQRQQIAANQERLAAYKDEVARQVAGYARLIGS